MKKAKPEAKKFGSFLQTVHTRVFNLSATEDLTLVCGNDRVRVPVSEVWIVSASKWAFLPSYLAFF